MIVSYDKSILTYISAIRSYYGLSYTYNPNKKLENLLIKRGPQKVFVLLVDGMGLKLIERKLPKDSFIRKHLLFSTTTVFPSATTAATTSILNGKGPNENCWLGWAQYFKEVDDVVIPFKGRSYYSNKDYGSDFMEHYFPYKNIAEELNDLGVSATTIFPDFVSGGAHSFSDLCNRLERYSANNEYQFIYAYWDKYDSYMHIYGPDNSYCDDYLFEIDKHLDTLASKLSNDTMLVVIADHGQVNITNTINLYQTKYREYFSKKPSLEPRATAFFIKDEYKNIFEKDFIEEYENDFILLTHQQVLDLKIFGEKDNHPRFEEFIGDYLAIAKNNVAFSYQENNRDNYKGQHGGMNDDELMIPVIVY